MIARLRLSMTRLAGAVLALHLLAFPALALSSGEVERVVHVLEQLAGDLGGLAYDEEAAEIWFEEDAYAENRIGAAGFSREGWQEAADRTLKAYFALMSRAEIDGLFASFTAMESRGGYSDAQREAARQMAQDMREKISAWRAEGAADASLVRPFAGRIGAALQGRTAN